MYTPGKIYTLAAGECRGEFPPPATGSGELTPLLGGPGASDPLAGVSRVAPLKLKIDVKLPCKSIVISSQYGLFIRRMI